MIVKNEEAMLARCLQSVKGADEIIIVDTGSIDKTKEIAGLYTDKIYDFEWCDDFSKARNFAKEQCTGDWILSIDADELLEDGGIEKIRTLLAEIMGDAVKIRMEASNNKYYVQRLFRNKPEVFFEGRIHEIINVLTEQRIEVGITFGSSPAHLLDPDRNIRILEKEYAENPTNTRNLYYLAREYAYRNQWEKALDVLNKYIPLSYWLPEKADAYFIMALCYWYDGKGHGELARKSVFMALNINANFKAAIQLMGHMSFEKNKVQWDRMAETATNEDLLFIRNNYLTI